MNAVSVPLIVFIASILIGLCLETVLFARLRRLGKEISSKFSREIIHSIRGFVMLWFVLSGFYIAILYLSLSYKTVVLLQHALFIITVASISVALSRIIIASLLVYTRKIRGAIQTTSILKNIIRLIIAIIGLSLVLNHFGITVAPLLTAFGISGLAVALALQPTLSNLFSGLQIVFSKNIQPGDYIRLESGEEGRVVDITWRHAQVRDMYGHSVVVPNAKLALATITNYNLSKREGEVRLKMNLPLSNDLDLVEKTATAALQKLIAQYTKEKIDLADALSIRYTALTGSTVELNITLALPITERDQQYLLQHDCIKVLHAALRKAQICLT
ncbi:MAG: mechanosensitive ion channel [Candidatus Kerfeldbacteria bacterium]|nr:mechanosensitive ion channel [Candidatus Kerfeldbacteria bacterium]